ncbi:MAG: hypothetical protein P1U32_01870 [Legionellaceae bacterium]|nr:hypothetical protein [Legionellaceae bacterium]
MPAYTDIEKAILKGRIQSTLNEHLTPLTSVSPTGAQLKEIAEKQKKLSREYQEKQTSSSGIQSNRSRILPRHRAASSILMPNRISLTPYDGNDSDEDNFPPAQHAASHMLPSKQNYRTEANAQPSEAEKYQKERTILAEKSALLKQASMEWNRSNHSSARLKAASQQPMTHFGTRLSHKERLDAIETTALNNIEGRVDPLYLFEQRISLSIDKLLNREKRDTAQFEKELKAHISELARGFRQYGQAKIADYAVAFGKALLGVLVSILTSPALAVSSEYRRNIRNTFFAGPETDESRNVQAKLGNQFVTALLSKAKEEPKDASCEDMHDFYELRGNGYY